jgi:hypothetical protein
MERHPQLTWIKIDLWPCKHALKWQALKDIPVLTPLYDTATRQQLLSSFSFITLTAEREAVTDNRFVLSIAEIELCSSVLDVICCIGSAMLIPRTLVLKFIMHGYFPCISMVRVTIAGIHGDLA